MARASFKVATTVTDPIELAKSQEEPEEPHDYREPSNFDVIKDWINENPLSVLWSAVTLIPAMAILIASDGFSRRCVYEAGAFEGRQSPDLACNGLQQLAVDAGSGAFWLLLVIWIIGLIATRQYSKA